MRRLVVAVLAIVAGAATTVGAGSPVGGVVDARRRRRDAAGDGRVRRAAPDPGAA